MLEGLYHIGPIRQTDEQAWVASVTFNPQHVVYQAHFPNAPITPAVVLLAISKEITEQVLNRPIMIEQLKVMKLLKPIVPQAEQKVVFTLRLGNSIGIVITIKEELYAKLQFTAQ